MHLRRKQESLFESAIGRVADPARRRETAEQATETATRIASELAKKSAELGSQLGERVSDVAHVVSEEGQALLKEHAKNAKEVEVNVKDAVAKKKNPKNKKPRKHRLRKVVLLSGAGAAAAYFLDPDNGTQRRAAARGRTSSSAQAVGDGLDRAANVAHHAAEATAEPVRAERY